MSSQTGGMNFSRRWVVGGLAVSLAASPVVARARQVTGDWIPELAGRWDVVFTVPAGDLATVWVVEPTPSGATSVATVGPNPMALALREVHRAGASVRLSGPTNAGDAVLEAPLDARRLQGRFTAGSLRGTFVATRRPDVRTHTVVEMFDQTIGTFETALFTPAPFDAGWAMRKAEWRQTLAAEGATERDLVRGVRTLIASTGLSHNDYILEPSLPPVANLAPAEAAVTWRRLSGGVGLVRIASFVESPEARQLLDDAFTELADTRGLVVDLRGNSGGNLGLAMRLGDRLFAEQTPVGCFATRGALDAAGVASMDALPDDAYDTFGDYEVDAFQDALTRAGAVRIATGGRAPTYAPPTTLLIDNRCASTTEAMAAVIKESGRARLFGAATAGRMLSSRRLPVLDGYTLRVAYADFRTPSGTQVEGVGVAPDETAGEGEAGVRAASAWLRRQG